MALFPRMKPKFSQKIPINLPMTHQKPEAVCPLIVPETCHHMIKCSSAETSLIKCAVRNAEFRAD